MSSRTASALVVILFVFGLYALLLAALSTWAYFGDGPVTVKWIWTIGVPATSLLIAQWVVLVITITAALSRLYRRK